MPIDLVRPRPLPGRFLATIFWALATVAATLGPGTATAQPQPVTNQRIRVGSLVDAYPYAFFDEHGRVDGFTANLVQAAAAAMDIDVTFVPISGTDLPNPLDSGEVDVVIPLAHTAERQKTMELCVPYLRLSGSVFIRRGTHPVETAADLGFHRIAVHPSSTGEEYLRRIGLADHIVYARSVEDSIHMVARGEADALLGSRLTILSIMHRDRIRNIEPTGMIVPDFKLAYSFALRKGNMELLGQLNEGLAIIMRNGDYERIYNHWYDTFEDQRLTREEVIAWVAALLGTFLVVVLLGLLHQRRLRGLVAAQAKEIDRQARWLGDIVQRARCVLWTGHAALTTDGIRWDFHEIFGDFAEDLVDMDDFHRGNRIWMAEKTPELDAMNERALHALRSGIGSYSQEFRVRQNGRTFWLTENVSLRPAEHGTWEAVGVVVDITRIKEAEAEIRRLNDGLELRVQQRTTELEAANRELESFSYSVSHDLRAPLRNIAGFAALAAKHLDPGSGAEIVRYLAIVESEAARLSGLIDGLLTFSRLSRRDMHRTPVPLGELVGQVVANELRESLAGRDIEWRIGPLPTVSGDSTLLRQVVFNLLSNAVKYTAKRERALIEVSEASNTDGLRGFVVRDNGAGFDPRYAGKLFGVFQRLHSAKEFDGAGIGLATVQRIVHRHGGTVQGEGRPGEGATFQVLLPAD